jgi:hypothetical protein
MNTNKKNKTSTVQQLKVNPIPTAKTVKNRRKRQRRRQRLGNTNLTVVNPFYQGNAPVSRGYLRPAPRFSSMSPTRSGSEFRVVGCDYIGSVSTVSSSSADNVYRTSPANSSLFPRLEAIASIFGKYAFNGLKFIVIGKAASTQAGDMTSVMSYSTTGSALTETQVKNRVGQVTSKFWENHEMLVDCGKATVPWFPMDSTSSDTSNFGYYHFFTESAGSSVVAVADLFVEYDVEFCEALAAGDPDEPDN